MATSVIVGMYRDLHDQLRNVLIQWNLSVLYTLSFVHSLAGNTFKPPCGVHEYGQVAVAQMCEQSITECNCCTFVYGEN